MKLYPFTKDNCYILLLAFLSMVVPVGAHAFAPSTYADRSVLASGRWVKISVPSTGVYCIPQATLKKWGFSNPSAVRVHGYGGARIADYLTESSYVDDLPQVASAVMPRGIVFYAVGPDSQVQYGKYSYRQYNPFSTVGYYYLTEDASGEVMHPEPAAQNVDGSVSEWQDSYMEVLTHERDLVSPGETGHLFVGEDFMYTRSQTFNFDLPDRVDDTDVWMRCTFMAYAIGKSREKGVTLSFTANGEKLQATAGDDIEAKEQNEATHGVLGTTYKTFRPAAANGKLNLNITLTAHNPLKSANLDAININYTAKLRLGRTLLQFRSTERGVRLSDSGSNPIVWDVTDPQRVRNVNLTSAGNGQTEWVSTAIGRKYVAWNDATVLPVPGFVDEVANQDIHGLDGADMVIFTTRELLPQARRLASIHENHDSMEVQVLEQTEVFNEFTSGLPDPNGFRRVLKMMRDRGGERIPRFAILLGRGSYDNRALTAVGARRNTMPMWQSDKGENDDGSYCTDDIIGALADNSGKDFTVDSLLVAVGRIPATTVNEARAAVDKISEYLTSMPRSTWKNRLLFLADDQNQSDHMKQCDRTIDTLSVNPYGQRVICDKIYIDSYEKVEGGMPDARTELYRALDEGAMIWFFVGHGNRFSLTSEKMVMLNDINNMYLRHYPILYAATCNFMRWDGSSTSGAEVLHFMEGGGTIATISANRPVYISENGKLVFAFGGALSTLIATGEHHTLGEAYCAAKNSLRRPDDNNKLRYALMGDPALPLIVPPLDVRLETMNGESISKIDQPTLKANQDVRLGGGVYGADGVLVDDFNGQLTVVLYDADYSTLSFGYDDGITPQPRYPFDRHGGLLYTGNVNVTDGRFDVDFAMPSYISNNFREATLNMYASESGSGFREAIGVNRSLYVYGYDSTNIDDEDPVIESMFLNHSTFVQGDKVDQSPMLIASISDNRGINLSTSGIGQQMTINIDGKRNFNDVSMYYDPDTVSMRCAGTIRYPMSDLLPGDHTLRLRVWDTAGNMTERSIDFTVEEGMSPKIFDVYTDANPAVDQARFYIEHNRPDQRITVKMTVYNMLGSPLWSDTQTARSDMFMSAPFVWDLTDGGGHRVSRGIYLYRAEVSVDGGECAVVSRRIAVAGQ